MERIKSFLLAGVLIALIILSAVLWYKWDQEIKHRKELKDVRHELSLLSDKYQELESAYARSVQRQYYSLKIISHLREQCQKHEPQIATYNER